MSPFALLEGQLGGQKRGTPRHKAGGAAVACLAAAVACPAVAVPCWVAERTCNWRIRGGSAAGLELELQGGRPC